MTRLQLPPEAEAVLQELRSTQAEAARLRKEIDQHLASGRAEIEKQREHNDEAYEAMMMLLRDRASAIDLIGQAWNDYEVARARKEALALSKKKHPAKKAADEVRAKGRELAKARRQAKVAEWIVKMYEWHFPWLAELRDLEWETSYIERPSVHEHDTVDAVDPVRHWLTPEEFGALTSTERNQRALDRYLASRRSPWEIGRDYERYIGYLRERSSAQVTYHGIFQGLEDLGRDLIAEKDG